MIFTGDGTVSNKAASRGFLASAFPVHQFFEFIILFIKNPDIVVVRKGNAVHQKIFCVRRLMVLRTANNRSSVTMVEKFLIVKQLSAGW